jgi:hypothetical protein
MKKLLPILSIAFLATACNPGPKSADIAVPLQVEQKQTIDTAGLADFQAWRAQSELAPQEIAKPERTVAYKAPVKRAATPVRKSTPVKRSSSSSTSSGSDNSVASSGGGTSESTQPAKAEKKGWSKAAKGAVIGGVAGAAGGAVINKKNRVAGAVIGAVIGAGGGYVLGRQQDKKDGRIEYVPIEK